MCIYTPHIQYQQSIGLNHKSIYRSCQIFKTIAFIPNLLSSDFLLLTLIIFPYLSRVTIIYVLCFTLKLK